MKLSLRNYKEVLTKELVKKAGKNIVRECDEVEKDSFQAYVDENEVSFDVAISLNNEKEIIHHSCDCNSKAGFCQHKTALLLHLLKSKPKDRFAKGGRRINQLEILIEEIDPAKLKLWIKDVLVKNKDLELAFIHQFTSQQKKYTPPEVKDYTRNAVKAVIKSRGRAEANEVKKIVELWTDIHDTIVNDYCSNVVDEAAFQNFDALIEAVEDTQAKIATASNRFSKYVESQLLKVLTSLQQLPTDEGWLVAIGYFADRIIGMNFALRTYYLSFVVSVLNGSSQTRKIMVTDKLVKQYTKCNLSQIDYNNIYTKTVFGLVQDSDLFKTYYNVFKPIRFDNDYNGELIGQLVESGHLRLAEKYCQEQIKANVRDEYNELYLQFLKEIYTIEKNEKKLAEVLKELFPFTFDFDDYLFICKQMEIEEERKKWRTRMLARARQMPSFYKAAVIFPFRLMDYEGKYKKMIEYINSSTPYSIIGKYANKMILADRNGFLNELFHKIDDFIDIESDEISADISALAKILENNYSKIELQQVIHNVQKRGWFYKENILISFLRGKKL
ncbi:hypothetical protein [Chitinophaga eiseniae]|uniref:SWIM-type domain-containing protein n=1 Tax=Chitinophaga eiseniae TaxID=634771 RepID=A0A847SUH1_9BACT|nr:hypothetical protein [Chitinophaga eiseniae]NLR80202.1 hypothetical protein [Chitinophaga eiseniae]